MQALAYPRQLRDHLLFVGIVLLILIGCPTLLLLSGFGQDPLPYLPTSAIPFLAGLAAGLLRMLLSAYSVGRQAALVAVAAAAALLLHAVAGWPAQYLLAPATALLLAVLFLLVPRGHMLAEMTVYTSATVLANYTLDAFIPVGGLFLVNVGTFFFGITFTQRDRVHKYGRRNVYTMILVAAVANVLAALSLDTPLRYVGVAFLAIIVSETVDTEIYQRLLHRPWLVRVASSNAVSAPLDSTIFTVLAFLGEPFATANWIFRVIFTDVLVKYASSIVVALPRFRRRPAS